MEDLNAISLPELLVRLEGTGLVRRLIELARDEDLGVKRRDITSEVAVRTDETAKAAVIARSPGVMAGLSVVPRVLEVFGAKVEFVPNAKDGQRVGANSAVATLKGSKRELLTVERTLLNLVARLSGVATRTAEFVREMGVGTKARLFDTRKTTPGLRVLEKYAVRCGGGYCHRIGLYDAVLIKDNHIAGVGTDELSRWVTEAARRAASATEGARPGFVEVEVETLEQLEAVLSVEAGLVDIVLLDNMGTPRLRDAVAMRDAMGVKVELEASGGVTLESIRAVAETGVDRISTGAVTHHAVWLDLALDVQEAGA